MTRGLLIAALLALPLAANAADAARTFKAKCAACHGADGKGQTDQGKKLHAPDFTSAAWQDKTKDDAIKSAMLEGKKGDGKTIDDHQFKEKVGDNADAMVKIVRDFKGK